MRYGVVLWIIVTLVCLAGCKVSKKILTKNNVLYRVNESGDTTKLEIYTIKKKVSTNLLVDKETYLSISKKIVVDEPESFNMTSLTITSANPYAAYRPVPNDPSLFFIKAPDVKIPREKFVYLDNRPVLQTLAIPLKFRGKPNLNDLSSDGIKRRASIDSFPQQTEAGFSVGFAFGRKFTINVYQNQKDAFNRFTNQYSFAIAGLVGTGAVDISRSTARFLPATGFTARKNPIISYGGVVMIGINNVNIGYALGADRAIGQYGSNWVFQGQLWQGIIIALDILK